MRLKQVFFAFKLAKQNLIEKKLRSGILFFSFILMLAILILSASMKSVLTLYYLDRYETKYENVTLTVSTLENSNTRYFSTRSLEDIEGVTYSSFFRTMLLEKSTLTYIETLAGFSNDFNQLTHLNLESLALNETIITRSMSDKLSLTVGDTIILSLGDLDETFVITNIIDDYGIFSSDKAFISHDNVPVIMKSMMPSLSSLNDLFFEKFNNVVYFTVPKEMVSILIPILSEISNYNTLSYIESYPLDYIDQLITRAISLYLMIFLFIGIAVILVLVSTYNILLKDKEKTFGIIGLLGGRIRYNLWISMVELAIYIVPSALLAYGIAYFLIDIGLNALGYQGSFHLNLNYLWVGMGFMVILFIGLAFIHFGRFSQKNNIEHTKTLRVKNHLILHIVWVMIIFVSLTINDIIVYPYNGLVMLILLMLLTYPVLYIMSHIVGILLYKNKKQLLPILSKVTQSSKHYLSVGFMSLISMISIFLLVITLSYMQIKIQELENEYHIDYMLTNVIHNPSTVLDEIKAYQEIDSASLVGIYYNKKITEGNQSIGAVYNMNPDEIPNLFGIEIDLQTLTQFVETDTPSILLPRRYEVLYGVNESDIIHLYLSDAFPNVRLKVIGFFDAGVGNTAYVNLYQFIEFDALVRSNILISTQDPSIRNILINRYQSELFYLIDFQEPIRAHILEVKQAMNYASLVSVFIVFGLSVSILNQSVLLLENMKPIYHKMSLLGVDNNRLSWMIFKVGWIQNGLVLLLAFGVVKLILPLFESLLKLFNEYEPLKATYSDYILSLFIGFVLLSITQVIYLNQYRHKEKRV